jgi:hypothetical protein
MLGLGKRRHLIKAASDELRASAYVLSLLAAYSLRMVPRAHQVNE